MVKQKFSDAINTLEKSCSAKAVGKVVEVFYERELGKNRGSYFPLVEFTTALDEVISIVSPLGTNPSKYSEGQIINIKYNPRDPKEFYIEGDDTGDIVSKYLKMFGVICAVSGAVIAVATLFMHLTMV